MNSRLETDLDTLDEPALVAARDPGNAALDAVSAVFSAADRRLTVVADNLDNVVSVGRNAAGTLFVNGGAVPISGGTPTVANTSQIQLFGQGGNDTLQLDETNGALPAALLFGSTGNDTLIGGSGADQLFGQDDNDTLLGKAGADQLFGGNGNDTLTGGSGNDALFGDAGNDRFVWNAGDGSDSADGGADFDLLEFNAGSTADVLTVVANGTGVRIDRVSPVAAHVDVTAIEGITIRAAGGDDTVTAGNGLAALTSLTLDGGTGNDTITGGDGADMLIGGEGNDQVTGGRGNDVGLLGNGNDTFSWNPGDGSDTLEGQGGTDALQFSGANISENFSIDANGGRVRLLRDVAAISMDMNDIEQIRLKLLGGFDNVTVGDLSGTDLREIRADLAGPLDPAAGDGQADTVTINGSSGDDTITLSLQNGEIVVSGLTARVVIAHADAIDTIRIQGLSGDDVVDASALGAAGPQIVIDGGAGNDIVLGGPAAETLLGNADDDVLLGGAGADVIDAGAGENVVLPDEGIAQLASAVLTLSGNASSNGITVSRDAAGHILATVPVTGTPTVANTSLIRVFGLAGDDVITLSETLGALPAAALYGGAGLDKLTGGSGADQLYGGAGNDQLSGKGGADLMFGGAGNDLLTGGTGDDRMFGESGDDQFVWNPGDGSDSVDGGSGADTLQVNAGNGTENFSLFANGAAVRLDRVDPAPFHIDAAGTETLLLNLNGGDDTLTAGNGLSTLIALTVDGGAGNDTITSGDGADRILGGDGNDTVAGGRGNDLALLGAGDDSFAWNPGDGSDTVEGQDGTDALQFNGANISENLSISANGARVRLFRDIAAVTMDLDDTEQIRLKTLGGADNVNVGDMTGTDLREVRVDLAGPVDPATGDSQVDNVTIDATNGDDIVTLALKNGQIVVSGLATTVVIDHADTIDIVRIRGLGGDDIIDASALGAIGARLIIDSGDGNDILLGGPAADTLVGGGGDDILVSGDGIDTVDGGLGDDDELQDAGTAVDAAAVLTLSGNASSNGITISRDAAGNILATVPVTGTPTVANTSLIRVFGLAGDDVITLSETMGALPAAALYGGLGNDKLTGGSGADQLYGGAGDDQLNGKGGADLMFGGDGNDVLTGGTGDDRMFGDAGTDRFVWNPGDGSDSVDGGTGADTLQVNAGNGAEVFTLFANGTAVRLDRVDPAPFHIDAAGTETLLLNLNGGDDTLTAGNGLSTLIALTVDGGSGNDTITGGDGADTLLGGVGNDIVTGGRGNDLALLGAGNDSFSWNPGDGSDTVEGQDGTDTLRFNGANISEKLSISANGARVQLARDIAAVTMDLDGTEQIRLVTLGGADNVTVGDLSGTDATQVRIDLAGVSGGSTGDGQADTVTVNATNGADTVTLTLSGGTLTIGGLKAQVVIEHFDSFDTVRVNGLGGNDTIDASGVGVGGPALVLDGGADDDLVTGGAGDDVLDGGPGIDVLIGGPGLDTFLNGETVIQSFADSGGHAGYLLA